MKMSKHLWWWTTFFIATFALSKVFEASRLLTSNAPEANVWALIWWGVLLLLNVLALGYDSYVKTKNEGKLVHQVWLFEKVHQFQCREKSR